MRANTEFSQQNKEADKKPEGSLFSSKPKSDNKPSGGLFGSNSGGDKAEGEKKSSLFGGGQSSSSPKPSGENSGLGSYQQPSLSKPTSEKPSTDKPAGGSSLFAKKTESTSESSKPNTLSFAKPKEDEKKAEAPKAGMFAAVNSLKKDDQKKEESKSLFGAKPTSSVAFGKPAAEGDAKGSVFGSKDDKKESASVFAAKPDAKASPFGAPKDKPSEGIKDPNALGLKPSKPGMFGNLSKTQSKDAKAGEENKGESKEAGGIKLDAPKSSEIEVIKKMSLDQVKKTTLDSTTLEDIFSSWYNKVENQSESFKKHAKLLKQEELELYGSITSLESLKQYSERVIQDYGTSISTMEHVAMQQEYLMKALDDIDIDVEKVLTKKNKSGPNFQNRLLGASNYEAIEVGNYRQQMDAKAKNVNQTLDRIDDTVQTLNNVLSSNKTEKSSNDNGEAEEVGNILNKSYDTLRWIQDTACDLNYQIELLDRDLDNL